jgi:C-terminal processing protease CtpA/Prc
VAGGVGLAINEDAGRWVVIGVQEGGAAHKAGMSKGDVITDVDGEL